MKDATGKFVSEPWEYRLWSKVEKTDECWLWTGSLNRHGYGSFWYGGRTHDAHAIVDRMLGGMSEREEGK